VQEAFIAKTTLGSGSVWDVGFSIDPAQTFLIVIDGTNQQVYVLRRKSLAIVATFGGAGHWPGSSTARTTSRWIRRATCSSPRPTKASACRSSRSLIPNP